MLSLKSSFAKSKRSKKTTLLILGALLAIGCLAGGASYTLNQQRSQNTTPTPQPTLTKKSSETPKVAEIFPKPTPQPALTPPATPCTGNAVAKLLIVSISSQHMWVCETNALVNQSAVTTGMTQAPNNVDDATPTGSWQIYSKQTNQHLRGSDINGSWDDFVQYWIPFDGPIGFHDASWQTFPFGSSQYAINGSHGCVHLPLNIIAWIYDWAPIGTTVTIVS